jgi:hypothetical protein
MSTIYPHRGDSRTRPSKIFGIGLSRTGTTSLHAALGILGFRSIHYPQLDRLYELVDDHDAASDTPVACSYRQLDARYPGSRFILTVRDFRAWLESTRAFSDRPVPVEQWKREVRLRTYGVLEWDRSALLRAYHRHIEDVLEYFAHRPEALLLLDITAGEGWKPLCAFLGEPVPGIDFPRENARVV